MRDKIFKLILIVMVLSVYIFLFNQETIELILETNRIFVKAIEDYYDIIAKQKRILRDINAELN